MDPSNQITEQFTAELDAAIQAHLDWTRRVLRCAVLREPPGNDVLETNAHELCRFGRWYSQNESVFQSLDRNAADRMSRQHERMHDAVRSLCSSLLGGGRASGLDLATFEECQSELIADMARFKTRMLGHTATVDWLTGLPLRRAIAAEFELALARADRSGSTLVVMLADVDHLRRVNEQFGHAIGDEALRHVAHSLRSAARKDEPVYRYGDEEFLLLLQVADREAGEAAASRLLKSVKASPGPVVGGIPLRLRISAGLTEARPDEPMSAALTRAESALFEAKRTGRDRCVWEGSGQDLVT